MGRSEILKLSELARLIDELEEEALQELKEAEEANENGDTKNEDKKEEAKPIVTKNKKKLTEEERERIIRQWGDPRTGEVLQVPLRLEGKEAGSLNLQVSYHPIRKDKNAPAPKPQEQPNNTENRDVENPEQIENSESDELKSGVLRVHLHNMKDLEKKKGSRCNPYAVVEINHERLIETEVKKKTNNPVYSISKDIFVKNINTASLKITVRDKSNIGTDPILGTLRCKVKPTMKYLLENPTNDWLELEDSQKGRVRISFDWFPARMDEENDDSPAIGICRIDLMNADNLKNTETLGKADPYGKITISGRKVGQTRIINGNLSPIWNETYYTIVQSRNDRVKFEMLDFNNINNDKKIGSVEYYIKDICDNITNEVGPSKDFAKMRVKPTINKLEDGRYDVVSPLYEKQQNNINCQGEVHFQIQYYPLTYAKQAENTEATETGEEKPAEKKEKPKIGASMLSGRGFSIFSSSQMGISSIDLNNPNKNNITGILRIKLEEAKNLRNGSCAYCEFAFDNSPDEIFYRSAVIKSSTPVWDEITEGLIMNIINNKLLFNIRVRAKESGPSDNDISLLALKFGLNDIASNLNKSVWFTDDKNNPEAPAVRMAFGYAPIDIAVPPKDYLPNMGVLTVNVDDGKVVAIDSSGTSDPYIIFNLNGNKVYTTKELKKTLTPQWNEKFDINIRSRRCAELELELMDWNKVEKHTLIGVGILSLVGLVPNQNLVVPVDIISKENKKVGVVNLVLNFLPKSVSSSKQDREKSSENASAPAKVINNVAQGGINVAKNVFKAPSSVVSGAASGLSKVFKGNKSKGAELKDEAPASVASNKQQQQIVADSNASESSDVLGQMPPSKVVKQETSMSFDKTGIDLNNVDNVSVVSSDYPESDTEGGRKTSNDDSLGTLHIYVIEAKNLIAADSSGTSDPYVKIMKNSKLIGKTKVVKKNLNPNWSENFKVNLGEVINQNLTFVIKDHNTISSKTIGELQVNTHNSFNSAENKTTDEWYDIPNNGGSIHIKLEYIADEVDAKAKKSSKKK